MSLKRTHAQSSSSATDQLYISSRIEDRDSIFIAYFSPTATAKDLQKLSEIQSASHRIAAWRTASRQKTLKAERIFEVAHDDDGENWAGKRLEKVLVDARVEGAAVVARWYGGKLLGPVRFTHIETCAREAIAKYKSGAAPDGVGDGVAPLETEQQPDTKKVKTVEERNEERARKEELIETLGQRDNSVDVLRQMLAEKQAGTEGHAASSPSKARPSYGSMSLEQLVRLEKARDATLAWLLKQIDKAEQEQKVKMQHVDAEEEDAWAAFEQASEDKQGKEEVHDHG